MIRNRIPIVATCLILLLGYGLVLVLGQASADVADGSIPSEEFGDDTAENDTVGWDWTFSAQRVQIKIFLDDGFAEKVTAIEVFIEPESGDPADFVDRLADSSATFPTERVLSFTFTTQHQLTGGSNVGIHLMGPGPSGSGYVPADEIRILTSDGPINTHLLIPTPTPTPTSTPRPPTTPVPIVEVPTEDVTTVDIPADGDTAIIQPSQSASVTVPDGSISVAVPETTHATTFQLAVNPSPTSVPAAPAGTTILRAFEINAHDTAGVQVSLRLLKPMTITAKYTAADVTAAPQKNPTNLRIARYDATTKTWTSLNTTVNMATQMLTAKTNHLSLFSVVGVEPPPQAVGTPTPTPEAPPTGDFDPGSGLVLALVIAGFLLTIAGGVYLTQARRLRN
ncbi:hypothetical protein ACFLX9_00685 [Chloroflexota bacterium]